MATAAGGISGVEVATCIGGASRGSLVYLLVAVGASRGSLVYLLVAVGASYNSLGCGGQGGLVSTT